MKPSALFQPWALLGCCRLAAAAAEFLEVAGLLGTAELLLNSEFGIDLGVRPRDLPLRLNLELPHLQIDRGKNTSIFC